MRSPNRKAFARLTLENSDSHWEAVKFAGQCVVDLDVRVDVPDVDTATIASWKLEAEKASANANDAHAGADIYRQLVVFAEFYQVPIQIAHEFYDRISDSKYQDLAKNRDHYRSLLSQIIEANNASLSIGMRLSLASLYRLLGNIDDANAWMNDDGTRKSFSDFLGKEDQENFRKLEELATPNRVQSLKATRSSFENDENTYNTLAQRYLNLIAKYRP